MVKSLDDFARDVPATPLTTSRDQFAERAYSLLTSTAAQAAFRIQRRAGRGSREVRADDGRPVVPAGSPPGRGRRLVRHGQRPRDRPARLGYARPEFPDDQEQPGTAARQGRRRPARRPFRARAARDTLVVMMGEFGRTPKINPNAGRDHHGRANSVLALRRGHPRRAGPGPHRRPGRCTRRTPGHAQRPGLGALPQAGHRPGDQVRGARRPPDPHRRRSTILPVS